MDNLEEVKGQYYDLIKGKKFAGNQPVTLTKDSFDPKEDYFVTPKVDGLRMLLFFTDSGVFSINSKLEFTKVKFTKFAKEFQGVLLDTELYKGKFYVFDILFGQNGTDLRKNYNLKERIKYFSEIIQKVKSKKLIEKKYSKLECCSFLKQIEESGDKFKSGELDGFILTSSGDYNSRILKWKPSELLSIDFEIKNGRLDTYFLVLQNKKVFAPKNWDKAGVLKYSKNQKRFRDSEIVEFIWESGKFKPIRSRPDKTKGNHLSVVLDNFREMTRPTVLRNLIC